MSSGSTGQFRSVESAHPDVRVSQLSAVEANAEGQEHRDEISRFVDLGSSWRRVAIRGSQLPSPSYSACTRRAGREREPGLSQPAVFPSAELGGAPAHPAYRKWRHPRGDSPESPPWDCLRRECQPPKKRYSAFPSQVAHPAAEQTALRPTRARSLSARRRLGWTRPGPPRLLPLAPRESPVSAESQMRRGSNPFSFERTTAGPRSPACTMRPSSKAMWKSTALGPAPLAFP